MHYTNALIIIIIIIIINLSSLLDNLVHTPTRAPTSGLAALTDARAFRHFFQ